MKNSQNSRIVQPSAENQASTRHRTRTGRVASKDSGYIYLRNRLTTYRRVKARDFIRGLRFYNGKISNTSLAFQENFLKWSHHNAKNLLLINPEITQTLGPNWLDTLDLSSSYTLRIDKMDG